MKLGSRLHTAIAPSCCRPRPGRQLCSPCRATRKSSPASDAWSGRNRFRRGSSTERLLAFSGVPAKQITDLDQAIRINTSFGFDQLSPVGPARAVTVPTLLYQVRDDSMTQPIDVQTIFDSLAAADKELFWIEGTSRRRGGYNYFAKEPRRMLDWFAKHMAEEADMRVSVAATSGLPSAA